MTDHNNIFYLEKDVIFAAGEDALQRLAEKKNKVFLDFKELERTSLDEKNKNFNAAQDVLKFLEKNGIYENSHILMKSGGVVTWIDPSEEELTRIKHITREPGTKSRLKREGKNVEFPKFLTYGDDLLKKGLIEVKYNGSNPTKLTIEKLLNECTVINDEPFDEISLLNNQFIRLNGSNDLTYRVVMPLSSNSDKSRFSINEDQEIKLNLMGRDFTSNSKVPGFRSRFFEQKLCYRNAIDDNIELQIISGGSGSGKSVVAYAAALHHILGTEKLRKNRDIKEGIVLFKSNDKIGDSSREQGFLKGTSEEKDWPYMKSYKDAHNLCGVRQHNKISFEEMLLPRIDRGKDKDDIGNGLYLPTYSLAIEIENLIYARGRTFENMIMFVDEAQNYTPFEMKHLIERMGNDSIMYLVGDIEQIDNPRLSRDFNGLTFAAKVMYDKHPRMSISHLNKNFRSQTAEIMRRARAPRD